MNDIVKGIMIGIFYGLAVVTMGTICWWCAYTATWIKAIGQAAICQRRDAP